MATYCNYRHNYQGHHVKKQRDKGAWPSRLNIGVPQGTRGLAELGVMRRGRRWHLVCLSHQQKSAATKACVYSRLLQQEVGLVVLNYVGCCDASLLQEH